MLVLSELALAVSCISIKFEHHSGLDVSEVSWFVRVLLNKVLAAILFVNCKKGRKRKISSEMEKYGFDNLAMNRVNDDHTASLRAIQNKPEGNARD